MHLNCLRVKFVCVSTVVTCGYGSLNRRSRKCMSPCWLPPQHYLLCFILMTTYFKIQVLPVPAEHIELITANTNIVVSSMLDSTVHNSYSRIIIYFSRVLRLSNYYLSIYLISFHFIIDSSTIIINNFSVVTHY